MGVALLAGCNGSDNAKTDIEAFVSDTKMKDGIVQSYISKGQRVLPGVEIYNVRHSQIDNLLEVHSSEGIFYTDHGFKKLIRGELFDIKTGQNLTVLSEKLFSHTPSAEQVATQSIFGSKQPKIQSVSVSNTSTEAPEQRELTALEKMDKDKEIQSLERALAEKLIKEQLVSATGVADNENIELDSAQELDITVKMDGRVDPDQIKNFRTHISYMGKDIPKIGYDSDGNRVSAEDRRARVAGMVEKIAAAGDAWSFNYKAENEIGSIVVFTDPSCPFCKRFHKQIPELNAQGISVYNLFYPRQLGAGLKGNQKAEHIIRQMDHIWFADDRQRVADDIYDGFRPTKKMNTEGKSPNPVFEHYLLGEISGMRGTPHILLSNGNTLRGYYSAEDIAKYMN